MISKYWLSSTWAATQVDETMKFMQGQYPEFQTLPWETRMDLALKFVSLRKQKLQENRYLMQLITGPLPLIMGIIGWIVALVTLLNK